MYMENPDNIFNVVENPEEGPTAPQHAIRHVVERTGPHENITEEARKQALTQFVNNPNRPRRDPARVYALWHLQQDYPQAGGKRKKRRPKKSKRSKTRKSNKHKKHHNRGKKGGFSLSNPCSEGKIMKFGWHCPFTSRFTPQYAMSSSCCTEPDKSSWGGGKRHKTNKRKKRHRRRKSMRKSTRQYKKRHRKRRRTKKK